MSHLCDMSKPFRPHFAIYRIIIVGDPDGTIWSCRQHLSVAMDAAFKGRHVRTRAITTRVEGLL